MTDVWTNPVDRVLRELISPAIWNADIAANLRLLSTHRHTGAAGDGAIISATEVRSGAMVFFNTPYPATNNQQLLAAVANQVRLYRFFLPFGLSLGSITLNVGTLSAATTGGVGIYNKDGTTLHASGTFSTASTGVKRVSVTPVTLPIDFYLLATTDTSIVPTVIAAVIQGAAQSVMTDTNGQMFTGANASAAGVLPATTGALSAVTSDVPFVKLEGS